MHTNNEMTEIVNKYATCMQEIKLRTNAVISIIKKETTTLYPYTNVEFLYLQIRKILELIVLANLVANNKEYQKIRQSFATDWNAKRIIETIKKINNDYFPKAICRKKSNNAKIKCEWKEKTSDILTENLFIDMYNEISCFLHAKNPFNAESVNIETINKKVIVYINLIINTLNEHNTVLCNGNIVNCNMNAIEEKSKSKEGKISVHYFEKIKSDEIAGVTINEQNR
jgi:hypothetical protein